MSNNTNNIHLDNMEDEEKEEPFSNFRMTNRQNTTKRIIFLTIALFIILFIIIFIAIYYFFFNSEENMSDKINEISLKYEINNIYNNIKLPKMKVISILSFLILKFFQFFANIFKLSFLKAKYTVRFPNIINFFP